MKHRSTKKNFWARAVVLAAMLMLFAAGAAFAGVNTIIRIEAPGQSGLSYVAGKQTEADLWVDVAPENDPFTLSIKVIGDAYEASAPGAKVRFTTTYLGGPNKTTPPSSTEVSFSGSSSSLTANLQFTDLTFGDRFTITAQLLNSSDQVISTAAPAIITIGFIEKVPLTGVAISAHGMSGKVVTIRSNDKPVELRAAPTPSNATSVAYSWSEQSDRIALDATTGSSVHVGPADRTIGDATVKLTATAYGETFEDSVTIRVVSADELADADLLVSLDSNSTAVYAVSTDFIAAAYPSVTPATITSKANSGLSDEAPQAVLISAQQLEAGSVDVKTERDYVYHAIANDNDELRGRFASGMSISMDVSDYSKSGGPIAMVPLNVAFSLPEKYPNGTGAVPATSGADLQGKYRLMKYFGNDKNNGVDISSLLGSGTHFADKNESTKAYKFKPLVVMVDSAAPTSATKAPRSSDCGVKYDRTHNVLYIFDGAHDGLIHDPLVLERTPGGGGGGSSGTNWFGLAGGGGGCATGIGLAALAALLAITRRKR